MAQPVPHQTANKKRVKVYELRNNDWFDRGTGFCSAAFVSVEDGQPKEAHVTVASEDTPERLLLETKICKGDGFQKQQDTLIVWTEASNGVDMALSFQEAEGCALIWKFIDGVQQTFQTAMGPPDDNLSDDLTMDLPATIHLPGPELANLMELEANMRIMSSSANGRDALAKSIVTDDYISKLIPLVEEAEDLEDLTDLHRLCNIMKMILLLNDTSIIEHAVSDECVIGVVGALEYDPDFPSHKANHRQWLKSQGRYKEVVRIDDDQIRRKIHQTYRLQYLKDVVLARILDDPTFSVLNSLIFFNQVDIVQHLQSNGSFLGDLFGIFADPSQEQLRKKEAVLFIQQCCAIAKNLQPPARQTLYTNFLNHGLFQVINFGLRNLDVTVRVGATDILVSMIDHDPQMVRHTIYRQIHEKQPALTDTLIDLLLVEVDLGIKSQVSDALKVLLDPNPPPPPPEARAEFMQNRVRMPAMADPQQDNFLSEFYKDSKSAVRLFRPLLDLEQRTDMTFDVNNDGIFSYLNDILCFYVRQHHNYSKYFVITHNIAQRFLQLLSCKEKHLQLVAIRFFRQLITLQDEFYIRHIAEKKILGPVLDVLMKTMPRDNLLCSACLDLFGHINKENVKDLMKHLVENYRDKLQSLSYHDTFRDILARYDNSQGFSASMDPYFLESEDEMGRRAGHSGSRLMMEHLAVDPAQEEYWNGSDDEDDLVAKVPEQGPSTNGAGSKPLVEYSSDEETEENGDTAKARANSDVSPGENVEKADKQDEAVTDPNGSTPEPTDSPTLPSGTPPERLSEKRRREEDEEDELGKLMLHKRRNSSSASLNSGGVAAALRNKKKGLAGSRDPSPMGGAKKIAISISSTAKAKSGDDG